MFSSEIKETVYIGVSLIIVAAVLGFLAIVLDIRGDFATLKNEEVGTFIQLNEHREFNAYDDKKGIYPEEVIALITKYYDSGLDIYLNAHDDIGILINKDTIIAHPEYTKYEHWKDIVLYNNIKNGDKYWIGLVYDYQDVSTIGSQSDIVKEHYSDITGIVILKSH